MKVALERVLSNRVGDLLGTHLSGEGSLLVRFSLVGVIFRGGAYLRTPLVLTQSITFVTFPLTG